MKDAPLSIFEKINGFDWDHGNRDKNLIKHQVTWSECEECFFSDPLLVEDDERHSAFEKRYALMGKTKKDRKLTIVFVVRNSKIRVISARDMSRKERGIYEKIEATT